MLLAARLELERRNRNPSEIIDLNLDNSRASEIEGLTEEYVNLENLSLIHVGLQCLKGFPRLTALKRLDLSDNNITGDFKPLVEACPNLEQLNLINNAIKEIEALRPLAELVHLTSLDVFNCPVADKDNFRKEVFEMIPSLKYLDGFDIDNQEEPDIDEDYVEDELSEGEEDEEEEELEEEDEGNEEATDDVEGYTNLQYEDEEEESVTNNGEEPIYNNTHSHLQQPTPRSSGKVGMTNHLPTFPSDDDNESDLEGEEGAEDEEIEVGTYPDDDAYLVGDDEDLSQSSGTRGVKRKYPMSSEEDVTNDSYVINE